MSEFEKSRWADREFSQDYLDDASFFVPFRKEFIEAVKSLYGHFISPKPAPKILDLGCGDGLFIQELTRSFKPGRITLADGSPEMLEAARQRLAGLQDLHFVQTTFQKLIADDPLDDTFDFIYSSLAIHHLQREEKEKLYAYIYKHLSHGGWFVHFDVVMPPSAELEKWYLTLWGEWIKAHLPKGVRNHLLEYPRLYKENPDNRPDSLDTQLDVLRNLGFRSVDCFYKYGIFSLFGGCRE